MSQVGNHAPEVLEEANALADKLLPDAPARPEATEEEFNALANAGEVPASLTNK
jgi:hypothetical protein